jgi:hypothetical protein
MSPGATRTGALQVFAAVLGDHLDDSDDVVIEEFEVFGWNPVFEDCSTTHLLNLVAFQKVAAHGKPCDVADAALRSVPVASDLACVVLVKDWVEDGLPQQSWGPRR